MSALHVVGVSIIAMVVAMISLYASNEYLSSCTEFENGNCNETGYKVSKWTGIISGIIAIIGFIISIYIHFKN